ncbi:MAG: DEAD/DEAH box helicase [Planctomycetia bacterium]|nr:DEAD/DEAH box helicase [Planctomycetia bacterium]
MQTRDELAERYLAQLPYPPYPVQEEALLAWFTTDTGVLVCAPTGTGKTMIAQAALFESLHNGTQAYYTTPLIALTEQKFQEMQSSAERWGFSAEDVGLVTGNRRVNPNARILVVVAEILLNRLLHSGQPDANGEAFDFTHVSAVVMDEFHNFADQQRGIVWELALGLLPSHVRLLLLSATVGNSAEFMSWLDRCHNRKIELVEGKERKVPLTFRWVNDEFLGDQMVKMAKGEGEGRYIPALVFCFNRDECWSVAEMLKGLDVLPPGVKGPLNDEVDKLEWHEGVGPKLKQMLRRGVGVHHAGMLGKYRRVVESLFERKLLSVCVCTETLAAGINLPARSVVLTTLVKGPRGKEKLVDTSTAQQIFGRAGRPQYDDKGFVFALAHEDDVRLLRWQEKYDQIPETTKDPNLIKAKKALKKKKPIKSDKIIYWTEGQFKQLQAAPPGKLYSKGPLPWRLLAYLLKLSPEVSRVRTFLGKRLMDEPRIRSSERQLEVMLRTLAEKGFVTLDPPPPTEKDDTYRATLARPTPALDILLVFRSIHPLYGAYLLEQLGVAGPEERLQALESVLEIPRPLLRCVRPPWPDEMPPGPLETTRLDPELISRGLIAAAPVPSEDDNEEEEDTGWRERPPSLADKLRLYFDATWPEAGELTTLPVWSAGELLRTYAGNFNLYVRTRDLIKQEGIIFRHLLRLILLCGEFAQVVPVGLEPDAWRGELRELTDRLTASCRAVDPASTDEVIQMAKAADVVAGESTQPTPPPEPPQEPEFAAGIFD